MSQGDKASDRRYSWLKHYPFRGRRLRMGHSFAEDTAYLSDSLMLAMEAQRVISLRLAAIARGGPAAEAETRLMVTEKMLPRYKRQVCSHREHRRGR